MRTCVCVCVCVMYMEMKSKSVVRSENGMAGNNSTRIFRMQHVRFGASNE